MLAKLETKSNRVKGLSFHPTRPWILASLHNGIIQLWDYRIRTLVDKFDEHDGPVRGICFHPTQPLFVSGGDDYKIKVWNYKQRRCLFTFSHGHLDYIRTVQFHHEYPWILSASDDQTIRIWNWQSRTCIAVLTGHNHYVMCASFHPKEDLVVSASLDQTVRVWDISGLRKKNVAPGSHVHHHDDGLKLPQNDLFGNTDAIVKYVLEGHDRGVNWASFHPTSPLIVSGADDRQVKLWRMNETKAWEVDTFRGHFNNVSCVLFHPRQELIISNSEDKTIRVWDIQKRSGIQTFRREVDRFWILAAHPELNLFAAGHDSGMIVFKLERERPAYAAQQNDSLFYVRDKFIRESQFASSRDIPVLAIKPRSGTSGRIRSLAYSQEDRAIIITSESDGGNYELYQIPKDGRSENVESKRGLGVAAVFIGRKRFVVLDKSHQLIVKDLSNEEVKKFSPGGSIDNIFTAPSGFLLLRADDKITLFDVQQRRSVAEINAPEVKYVYWSQSKSPSVALVSKDTIVIANKRLEQLCTVHEAVRIKSGAWDDLGVFIYSTSNHIKYCLPNGDNGIIRTLDSPLYITAVKDNKVFALDRDCKNRVILIDTTEYTFKYALTQRMYSVVLKMVKEYNLIGQAIISYLQRKGFPEVALYFVKDEKTRFNLALECGNIEVALESAKILDDKESWNRIGVEALRQGNHQIVEMAYQRTKNFERLSFLYLITGNVDKLKKMLKISEMRNDVMSRFHNSLYLGDVTERVKILEEVGQVPLAYVTAKTHGLHEHAEALLAKLTATVPENQIPALLNNAKLLMPPLPIMKLHESNWPLLNVSKGYFDGPVATGSSHEEEKRSLSSDLPHEDLGEANWDDMNIPDEEDTGRSSDKADQGPVEKSEWDVDEIEIDDVDIGPAVGKSATGKSTDKSSFVVLPHAGPTAQQIWCGNSNFAGDHAAAGALESAMKLLNQQIGVVNFSPLKPLFSALYSGSRAALPTTASVPSLVSPIHRNSEGGLKASLPSLALTLQPLIEVRLKAAYKSTYGGKFVEALQQFVSIIHSIPLLVVESKKEANEAKQLITVCREYITGLRMELHRKELAAANEDPVRQLELAAYFTHCNLESVHLMLSLRSAMNTSYKMKNFLLAASFARRLLDLNPSEEIATQALKVVKFAEQNPKNSHNLNYNERNPFVVCGISFTPIYKGSPSVTCPYCQSSFLPAHKDKLCPSCKLSQIGKDVSGLQIFQAPREQRKKEVKKVYSDDEEEEGWN